MMGSYIQQKKLVLIISSFVTHNSLISYICVTYSYSSPIDIYIYWISLINYNFTIYNKLYYEFHLQQKYSHKGTTTYIFCQLFFSFSLSLSLFFFKLFKFFLRILQIFFSFLKLFFYFIWWIKWIESS